MSKWLILIGIICIVVGVALKYAPWLLSWFGNLPGDINIRSERGRVFIPITSMVIVSIVLSLVLGFLRK